jgi:hypothetical protein
MDNLSDQELPKELNGEYARRQLAICAFLGKRSLTLYDVRSFAENAEPPIDIADFQTHVLACKEEHPAVRGLFTSSTSGTS